jgi:hypothetical protein
MVRPHDFPDLERLNDAALDLERASVDYDASKGYVARWTPRRASASFRVHVVGTDHLTVSIFS